jgi:replication fork clamp-binding protein CrfC
MGVHATSITSNSNDSGEGESLKPYSFPSNQATIQTNFDIPGERAKSVRCLITMRIQDPISLQTSIFAKALSLLRISLSLDIDG